MIEKVDWFLELEEELKQGIVNLEELVEDNYHHIYHIEAIKIEIEFLNKRYEYYYKHYNKDLSKMDDFIFKKIVEEFTVFTQTSYGLIAGQYETDVTKLNTIKRFLNAQMNHLQVIELV